MPTKLPSVDHVSHINNHKLTAHKLEKVLNDLKKKEFKFRDIRGEKLQNKAKMRRASGHLKKNQL